MAARHHFAAVHSAPGCWIGGDRDGPPARHRESTMRGALRAQGKTASRITSLKCMPGRRAVDGGALVSISEPMLRLAPRVPIIAPGSDEPTGAR